jgi:hypothetical protein
MRVSIFDDPLATWNNHDLLLDAAALADLETHNPKLFRVLDWPELREAFVQNDRLAAKAKWLSKHRGVAAVVTGGLGLAVLGAEGFFNTPEATAWIRSIALALMTAGGLLGIFELAVLRARREWLAARFWSERLRQVYFQFLVREHILAARAIDNDLALEEFKELRAALFKAFYVDPEDPRVAIKLLMKDLANDHVWVVARPTAPPPPELPAALDMLLMGLRYQRIGVQEEYSAKNLGDDIYSAPLRDRLLRLLSDLALGLTLAFAVCAWIATIFDKLFARLDAREWLGAVAVVSACGLIAKALKEGLKTEAELARYEGYSQAVARVRADFDSGHMPARIAALEELEKLAYIELRSFLAAHHAARFIA